MDLNQVFKGLDELFEQHKLDQVEEYLGGQLEQAVSENDFEAMVSILNEMLGFARETSQYDKCEIYGSQALKLIENSPYKGTISHATTMLNVANAMRAAGRLEESLANYRMTEQIYNEQLPERDYQFASLYNNEGLLFEEMQEYEKAADAFEKAIEIVSAYDGNEYYQAVSYANLANANVMLQQYERAEENAQKAIQLFEPLNVNDSHKGAALAAFGEIYLAKGKKTEAIAYYEEARNCIFNHIGKNAAYYRVEERLKQLKQNIISGAKLCREYYEQYGAPMIEEKFPQYVSKIAVGHVGEGSDCFGFDDSFSTDHDFGPGFSMWVTADTYKEIGESLQQAYMNLPDEFKGFHRVTSSHSRERFGVCVIDDFYERVLAGGHLPEKESDYLNLEDCYLAAAVNGEVYRDDEGIFTSIRNRLKAGYPEGIGLLKLAQKTALYGQNGQYNYERCARRGEWTAAMLAKSDAMRQSMQIAYLLAGIYAPHDKWLHRGLKDINSDIYTLVEDLTICDLKDVEENCRLLEEIAGILLGELIQRFYVTSKGDFLPDISVEIARRGQLYMIGKEKLLECIESCKDNVGRIDTLLGEMPMPLLVQYCYDCEKGNAYPLSGNNVPEQRREIIKTILSIENEKRTSDYMTILCNEIETFSDAMLVQYGRYVANNNNRDKS